MSPSAPLLRSCAALIFLGFGAAAAAETVLTVHNLSNRTLTVTRPWSPWRPEPDDPPQPFPLFREWLRPGAEATYRFQTPGKELESDLVVRRLPRDGRIEFECLTLQAMDPGFTPIGEDLPPEPEAPAGSPAGVP
jgi:hypothetical protein